MARTKRVWPWIAGGAALVGITLAARRASAASIGSATPRIGGAVFTIVLENHDIAVLPRMPYLASLADRYAQATNYTSNVHPSLPNYLLMTSGQDYGIRDDGYHSIPGQNNVFAQLEATGVPWRAFAESMGSRPCRTSDSTVYASRHNPAVYYQSVTGNPSACDKVVGFGSPEDIAGELGSNADLRYVWITPNLQNDLHDGTVAQGDRWLTEMIPVLMESSQFRAGGVIFVLFDEPEGASTRMPCVVISGFASGVRDAAPYGHRNYLATVQDLLGIGRLPGTAGVGNMAGVLG